MVYSDASIEGWGGHTQGLEVSFFINDGGSQCLNTLEGHICERCSFSGHRQFHSGGISEQARGLLARRLLLWAAKYNIIVRARHIPGRLNVIADGLSRKNQIVATEWSLCPPIVKELSHQMGGSWIDLFATRHTTR